MPTFVVTCAGCGTRFQAKSPRAKWHKPGCKKQAQRTGAKTEAATQAETAPSGLVAATRAELEKAQAVDTFAGQLALELARRLTTPAESGISSLAKELRTVMAAATAHLPVPTAEEPEDEVAKARRRAEEKRRQAG